MNYEEIIHFIEDKQISIEEKDYFYHAFAYDQNEFINMLNNGIKSPILLGKSGSGLNGNFYVSLSKKENYETQSSINKQLFYLPTFVINDKLKAVKAINCTKIKKNYPRWIRYSPLPFRESIYDDEYQKFLQVPSQDILAIEYNLKLIFEKTNRKSFINDLIILKNIIDDLNSQNFNLPIIDYHSSKEINKDKVLSLHL